LSALSFNKERGAPMSTRSAAKMKLRVRFI
jgi:hypothetical protein